MLVFIDTETSGLDRLRHNMLSLGAITEDGRNQIGFECRLHDGEEYSPEALAVNGYTVEQIFDKQKLTRQQVYHDFSIWLQQIKEYYNTDVQLAGENIGSFDVLMLSKGSNPESKINLLDGWNFGHRYFDVATLTATVLGKSMSQDKALQALGLEAEPKPHNALVGAKSSLRLYNELQRFVINGTYNMYQSLSDFDCFRRGRWYLAKKSVSTYGESWIIASIGADEGTRVMNNQEFRQLFKGVKLGN